MGLIRQQKHSHSLWIKVFPRSQVAVAWAWEWATVQTMPNTNVRDVIGADSIVHAILTSVLFWSAGLFIIMN